MTPHQRSAISMQYLPDGPRSSLGSDGFAHHVAGVCNTPMGHTRQYCASTLGRPVRAFGAVRGVCRARVRKT